MFRSTTFVVILTMGVMGSMAAEDLKDYYYDHPSNISTRVFNQSNCNRDDGDKCEAHLSQSVALISVLNPS